MAAPKTAADFWTASFGSERSAEWRDFLDKFEATYGKIPKFTTNVYSLGERGLQLMIFNEASAKPVTKQNLEDLEKWFGPFDKDLPRRVAAVLNHPAFIGRWKTEKIKKVLSEGQAGSFLVGLYDKKPGTFRIYYLGPGSKTVELLCFPFEYKNNKFQDCKNSKMVAGDLADMVRQMVAAHNTTLKGVPDLTSHLDSVHAEFKNYLQMDQ